MAKKKNKIPGCVVDQYYERIEWENKEKKKEHPEPEEQKLSKQEFMDAYMKSQSRLKKKQMSAEIEAEEE